MLFSSLLLQAKHTRKLSPNQVTFVKSLTVARGGSMAPLRSLVRVGTVSHTGFWREIGSCSKHVTGAKADRPAPDFLLRKLMVFNKDVGEFQ